MASKYQPLGDYLARLPAEADTATLTLPEVASVVGLPLPRTASLRTWWWNDPAERPHAAVWLDAGWRVAGLTHRTDPPAVTFARTGTVPRGR